MKLCIRNKGLKFEFLLIANKGKMKRQDYINKIKSFDNKWFNSDQKIIAINIIENTPEENISQVFDLLKFKKRVGFTFDSSPEIAQGRIIIPKLKETIGEGKNDNMLLIGDNYDALKVLQLTHEKKVDAIYIDPPYNTDKMKEDGNQSSKENNESSKFIYKDKFGREGWLNMINERLKLAKNLLKNDGVIFISIDDSEQAYLKVLMDEIFGEENFIANLPRRATSGGKGDAKYVRSQTDYILIYKMTDLENFEGINANIENYKSIDPEKGNYYLREIVAAKGIRYSKSLDYDIEIAGETFAPILGNGDRYCWRWGRERMEKAIELGIVEIKNGKLYQKAFFEYEFNSDNDLSKCERKIKIDNLHFLESKYSNTNGIKVIKEIFGDRKFDYPKPPILIKDLLKLIGNREDAVILDFFAGSGTTGQAVMEINREENKNWKFILATNNENNIAYDITSERFRRIIDGNSMNGDNIPWINKNEIFGEECLKVFDLDNETKINVTISEEDILQIQNEVTNNLQIISNEYKEKKLNLYYDLAALNPLEGNDEIN